MPDEQPKPQEHPTWEHLHSWREGDIARRFDKPKKRPWWPFIVVGAILFFGLAYGYAYYQYLRPHPLPAVELSFIKGNQVSSGQEFRVSVAASNLSQDTLKNVRISILLPDDVYFAGASSSQRFVEMQAGDIGPGVIHEEGFALLVVGSSQSVRHLKARMIYSQAKNPNAQFEKIAEEDIVVGQPTVGLAIETPKQIFKDQEFRLAFKYQNNSKQKYGDVRLTATLPPAFIITGASSTFSSTKEWVIGDLAPSETGLFEITGSLSGEESSNYNFTAVMSGSSGGEPYILNSQTAVVAIAFSPLSVTITGSSGQNNFFEIGGVAHYEIAYKNNSQIPMNDVVIRTKILSDLFDLATVSSPAAYDSVEKELTWNVANTPVLASISPGQSGKVDFNIRLLSEFPINEMTDKDFTVSASSSIESPTVPSGTEASKTVAEAATINKIAGNFSAEGTAYWRDAGAKIVNSGPYPMKVNAPTQFTVHWILTATAADARNIRMSAHLKSNTKFTGVVKSNVGTRPEINNGTGEVSWTIPVLPANTGVISDPAEAVFQIETVPAVTQKGQILPLVGEVAVTMEDAYAGRPISLRIPETNSRIPYDESIPKNTDPRVRP